MTNLYNLKSIPYYDSIQQSYRNILVINKYPDGNLATIVKKIYRNKLSPFDVSTKSCPTPRCIYAIQSLNDPNKLMCDDDITDLFEFFTNNGYNVDASYTKIMQKTHLNNDGILICVFRGP